LKLIKWTGTGLCLVGIALTSFNIYPLNLALGLVGSALWTLAGWLQRDPPLVIVEVVAVGLYASGIISFLFMGV
jgi:hypothetical protein